MARLRTKRRRHRGRKSGTTDWSLGDPIPAALLNAHREMIEAMTSISRLVTVKIPGHDRKYIAQVDNARSELLAFGQSVARAFLP